MNISKERYAEKRAALLSDFLFLKSHRCRLCAKDRVRKIAKLDFEYDGTPIKHTLQAFDYDNI